MIAAIVVEKCYARRSCNGNGVLGLINIEVLAWQSKRVVLYSVQVLFSCITPNSEWAFNWNVVVVVVAYHDGCRLLVLSFLNGNSFRKNIHTVDTVKRNELLVRELEQHKLSKRCVCVNWIQFRSKSRRYFLAREGEKQNVGYIRWIVGSNARVRAYRHPCRA